MDRGQAEQPENEEACPGQQQHQQDSLRICRAEPQCRLGDDQAEQPEQGEDQAEQTGREDTPPSQTDSTDDVPRQYQGLCDDHYEMHGGQAEQTGREDTPPSQTDSTDDVPRQYQGLRDDHYEMHGGQAEQMGICRAEPQCKPSDDQAEQPEQGENQAEQNRRGAKPPSQTDSQDDVPRQYQGQRDDQQMHEGRAEQMEQSSPSHSFSTQPHKTIQPLTIMRSVRRCVSVQHNNISNPLLTSHNLGIEKLDRGQAEQPRQAPLDDPHSPVTDPDWLAGQAEQKIDRGCTQENKTQKHKPNEENN